MAADQLLAHAIQYICNVEIASFRTNAGIKYQVHHYISQLLFHLIQIAFQYGVRQFVGFLNR
ncbi:hypothetical protein D3C87_2194560 [compost metagenome]